MERPDLNKSLDSDTFRSFYYLKEELVDFCRQNGLPVSGGKLEITERIAYFLDTGDICAATVRKKQLRAIGIISEDSEIEPDFVCSEKHRDFFADNQGRTLEDAIKCWKYKKGLRGHNRYEKSDIIILKSDCTKEM